MSKKNAPKNDFKERSGWGDSFVKQKYRTGRGNKWHERGESTSDAVILLHRE